MKENLDIGFKAIQTDTDSRLHFAAAAASVGFDLAEGTPKVSNCYDSEHKYEPGQPGDVRMYLPLLANGININEFVTVWKEPETALREAESLPARIQSATDPQTVQQLIFSFDALYMGAAVAYMKLHSLGRVQLPDVFHPSDEEKKAILALDYFSTEALESAEMRSPKGRKTIAQKLARNWQPAIVAWLKSYRANLLELRNLWKDAPQSIRINRGNGLPPLVLEKGPHFKELLERWT